MTLRMRAGDWALLLVLSLLWGGSFFFVGVTVRELPPLVVVTGRVGIASFALAAILLLGRWSMPKDLRTWGAFLVMGLLNGLIPFSLIVWGQSHISSGTAAIFNSTTPLFSVVLAHFVSGGEERLTANRLLGVLLGICGVAALVGPQALTAFGTRGLAELAVLGASFSYACGALWGRRFRGMPPMVAATGQIVMTFALVLPLSLMHDDWSGLAPSWGALAALLGLGLLSTVVAYLIYFRLLAGAGATNVLLVTLLIPASASLLGYLFLGESLGARSLVAMAVILAGIAAVDGRLRWPRWARS